MMCLKSTKEVPYIISQFYTLKLCWKRKWFPFSCAEEFLSAYLIDFKIRNGKLIFTIKSAES